LPILFRRGASGPFRPRVTETGRHAKTIDGRLPRISPVATPPGRRMSTKIPLETDCTTVKAKVARGGKFVLVDCREQDEYDRVHIDGAKLVPMSQLADRLGELEPYRDWDLAVHCHHGGRSLRVVQWLREQGFTQAQSMAGGIDQWAVDVDPSLDRY
jgi:rhodanese-related sulfurtransferase